MDVKCSFCHINCNFQHGVIYKLSEVALDPDVYVTDKDIKEYNEVSFVSSIFHFHTQALNMCIAVFQRQLSEASPAFCIECNSSTFLSLPVTSE